ncbi:MAG: ABC transporter ATP-binding protein [Polyangiaceae bacterium]|nr:ABC transporter ATP-binding protein [Polyangiaceae bacterium]MCE7892748.1 ABC transporter ATP-binding protein [Sorangiineae bacterium PRO1]MCL4748880.1 ABC transporter ATP-binding protein [Myxococcales bacterium]
MSAAPELGADNAVVEFRQVFKIYGAGDTEVRALDGVDMRIERGEFVAIMGSSGSGKSTAMNIIGCLDAPTSGQYLFRGVDVGSLEQDQRALLRRHYVGFVFQGYNLLARTTALENVELPLVYRRVPMRERHEKAMEALSAVGLADRADHTPAELSGGQQQRVAIARALVSTPSLLLADEPTGNLDSSRKHEIMELLVRLNQERGITIAMVTHEPDMGHYVSRVVMFKDGRIVDQGRPENVEYAGPISKRPLSQRGQT